MLNPVGVRTVEIFRSWYLCAEQWELFPIISLLSLRLNDKIALVSGQHIKHRVLCLVPKYKWNCSDLLGGLQSVKMYKNIERHGWILYPNLYRADDRNIHPDMEVKKGSCSACLCLRHLLEAQFWPAWAEDSHTALGVWEMPVSLRPLNLIMLHFRSSDQLT